MISHRRASRNCKRKHKELEEKERTKEKEELGNETEEGRSKTKKKKKKKKSRIWRILRWRTKVTDEPKLPKLKADAYKKNKIEEEEKQDQEAKDEGEDALKF